METRAYRWQAKVTLTNHAKERLSRGFGLSEKFVKKDIRQHIYALRKERGANRYLLNTCTFKYILSENLEVITILYRRNKKRNPVNYFGREYINLNRELINNLIKNSICKKKSS